MSNEGNLEHCAACELAKQALLRAEREIHRLRAENPTLEAENTLLRSANGALRHERNGLRDENQRLRALISDYLADRADDIDLMEALKDVEI